MTTTDAPVEVHVQPGESVQAAVEKAGPGGVVRLAEGTFPGSVAVSTSDVTIIGAGAGRTVLVPGPIAPSTIPQLHDAGPDVVSGIAAHGVSGLTVEGLTVRGFSGAGVYAHTCTGVRLVDVEADGNRVWGLYLRESSGIEVRGCRGAGSQYAGVALAFCPAADALVTESEATGNAFGVFVDNSSHARVVGNDCHGNAAGVLLLHQTYEGELPGGVADVLVSDNDIHDNTLASGGDDPDALGSAGPPISGVGIAAVGVQRAAIVGNRLHGNKPGGPSVMAAALVLGSSADWGGSDSVDNSFEWNTITGNEPFDMQIGTDPGNQRFRNNIVGVSQPETVEGCRPERTP